MNVVERFIKRTSKLGIEIKLSANLPWIYIHSINGKRVTERFHAEHGFTAFWYPVKLDQDYAFSNRREVFKLVRTYL